MPLNPYLIGIAGPSGSGKTELAKHLCPLVSGLLLPLDHYYLPFAHLTYEERCRLNFDHPDSLDWPLIAGQFGALRRGTAVEMPIYDFATHLRRAETLHVEPRQFLIVEGILALQNEALRDCLDTRVYVELEDEVCFRRRLYRDMHERGRSEESVTRQYAETVRPMAERYVRPTREFADVVVRGDELLERSSRQVLEHVRRHMAETRTFSATNAR